MKNSLSMVKLSLSCWINLTSVSAPSMLAPLRMVVDSHASVQWRWMIKMTVKMNDALSLHWGSHRRRMTPCRTHWGSHRDFTDHQACPDSNLDANDPDASSEVDSNFPLGRSLVKARSDVQRVEPINQESCCICEWPRRHLWSWFEFSAWLLSCES